MTKDTRIQRIVEDTIDRPVKTLEVNATGNKYTDTSSKKERSSIQNTNGKLEPPTSFHTRLTKHSLKSKEHLSTIDENVVLTEMGYFSHQDLHNYDNNCYQGEENNDVTLFFPHQKDQKNDEKLRTKSKCQIQPENNLISSVFFCNEGCFQHTSDNKVVTGDLRT